jgi:soluble lytic murein transglycosylase-like protein
MMTVNIAICASKLCRNSKKPRNSLRLRAALAAALALSIQVPAFAGNGGGGSMYFAPPVQEAPSAAVEPAVRAQEKVAAHRGRQEAPERLVDMVSEAARRHGVPAALANAIIKIESGYNCRARGAHGVVGIGQIMPATARAEGVTGDLTDCATGLEAAMRYLAHALAAHGAGCEGASAYNTGIASLRRCTGYGRKAMQLARLP